MIVVDASVTLAWCLSDESDQLAERVLERVVAEGALAPAHWPIEVANGILSAERRGRLDAEGVERVTRLLNRLGVEVVPVELTTALWTVLDSAREHKLSVYDATYLDLARFRDAPLATLDSALRDAAASAGIALAD